MSNNDYEQKLFWKEHQQVSNGKTFLRVLHISDTHGFHEDIPINRFIDVDLVIHSGDASNHYSPVHNEQEMRKFLDWYEKVPVKHKIYVPGNHDTSIEAQFVEKKTFEDRGIHMLINESVEIEGFKIWGSPYTPTFGKWSFMKSREKLNDIWQMMPDDTEIVIVHGPPKTIRDLAYNGKELEFCGCEALRKRLLNLSQLKLMCFGHIHNNDGIFNQGVSTFDQFPGYYSNGACVTDRMFNLGLSSYGNTFLLSKNV